jgi:TRAP-type C4-dicarboxylate transport system permease large subunit
MAGFVPGIAMSIGMMVALAIIAKRNNYPTAPRMASVGEIWKTFKEAFWCLLAPVIIIGGIMSGFFIVL